MGSCDGTLGTEVESLGTPRIQTPHTLKLSRLGLIKEDTRFCYLKLFSSRRMIEATTLSTLSLSLSLSLPDQSN